MSTFKITESVAGAAINVPVKLSAVLKEGEFNSIGVIFNGTLVPCQYNILAKHQDGSIRHALVMFWMDTTGVIGTTHNVVLDPVKQLLATGVAIPKKFDFATLACKVQIIDSQDVTWTKEVTADSTWPILRESLTRPDPLDMLHGPLANEIEYITTLDGLVGPHQNLNFVARWRFFKDWPGVRVEFVFEASNQKDLADISTKSITIWLDGQVAFSIPNKIIGAGQRFRVVRWVGLKPPIDDFNVRQDRVYLRDMGIIPLYDLNNPLSTADVNTVIGNYFKNKALDPVNHPDGLPLVNGVLFAYQPGTGDRADIDPQPDWATCTWNSEDPRAAQVQMAADGNNAGAFPVHIRDPSTNVMGLRYNYHITSAKGKWNNPCVPNRAHHALVGFISYVITGDKYYAEELAAWATYCTRDWPWDGKFKYPGSRDDAWTTRTVALGAYILPDVSEMKIYCKEEIDKNLDDWMTWIMDETQRPLHTWEKPTYNGSGRDIWPVGGYISPWQYAWKVWSLYLVWKLFNDERAKILFDWSAEFHRKAYVTSVGETFTSKDGQVITWTPEFADQYSFCATKFTPKIDAKGSWVITPGTEVSIKTLSEALWYTHVNSSNEFVGKKYPPMPPAGPEPENWTPNPPTWRIAHSTFEAYSMEDLAPTLVVAGVPDADKIWAFIEPYVDLKRRPKGTKRVPTLS